MKYLLLMVLVACTGDKGGTGDSGSGSSSTDSSDPTDSSSTDTDSGGGGGDVKPEVTNVTAANCTTNSSNPDAVEDSWLFTLSYDDPQGAETVHKGSMEAKKGDKVLTTLPLACRDGNCAASTRSSIDNITCDLKGTLVVVFSVTDDDGNESAPYEYQTE